MNSPEKNDSPSNAEIIEIWKTIISAQTHFNDIEMRIRSLFVTLVLALFASIGFILDKKWSIDIWVLQVDFAFLLCFYGTFGTYLFYFIDRYWYHRLLIGSVKHAIFIETKYSTLLPELSLSGSIRKESPYRPGRAVRFAARLFVWEPRLKSEGVLHSDAKIEFFYKSVMIIFLATALLIGLSDGVRWNSIVDIDEDHLVKKIVNMKAKPISR